jgi:hypothetical protein
VNRRNSYDFLNLLSAMPDAWKARGSIKGLWAKGGYEIVSIE